MDVLNEARAPVVEEKRPVVGSEIDMLLAMNGYDERGVDERDGLARIINFKWDD